MDFDCVVTRVSFTLGCVRGTGEKVEKKRNRRKVGGNLTQTGAWQVEPVTLIGRKFSILDSLEAFLAICAGAEDKNVLYKNLHVLPVLCVSH